MRNSLLTVALLLAFATPIPLHSQASMPHMSTVEPASGTPGDVITVTGENLDQSIVAALYLTDGKNDTKVAITEQSASAIKFKIPAEAKAGRFALMVLTRGKEPKLIEEPVKVTIEASVT
jgi:hypothetical protein